MINKVRLWRMEEFLSRAEDRGISFGDEERKNRKFRSQEIQLML